MYLQLPLAENSLLDLSTLSFVGYLPANTGIAAWCFQQVNPGAAVSQMDLFFHFLINQGSAWWDLTSLGMSLKPPCFPTAFWHFFHAFYSQPCGFGWNLNWFNLGFHFLPLFPMFFLVQVGTNTMDNPLLKYSAKEYFFKAALCHFIVDELNAKVSYPRIPNPSSPALAGWNKLGGLRAIIPKSLIPPQQWLEFLMCHCHVGFLVDTLPSLRMGSLNPGGKKNENDV